MRHAFVLLVATVVFFVQGPRFVFHLWDRLFDPGDSFINSWILAWNAHALLQPALSVWDAPIFHPVRGALAFSEAMFGNLWITLPVQDFTGNPAFAANVLFFLSFVFGAYSVFLLVHDLTRSFWSGLIAGIVFSFNPYRWGHGEHLQLLPFFWAPLALIFANRFMVEPKRRYLLGLVGATVIQYYVSIYLGTMLVTLVMILFAAHLFLERRSAERWRYVADPELRKPIIFCCAVAVLLLLPLAVPYLKAANAWHFYRGLKENCIYSAEPLSFLLRPLNFASYGWLNSVLGGKVRGGEGAVFLGFTPWVLAGLALVMVRQPRFGLSGDQKTVVRRYAWAALVLAILMLGPYLILFDHTTRIPLPYQLVYYLLPGAKAIRVPARLAQALLLCLAVIGGCGVAAFVRSIRGWGWMWKSLVLVVFVGFLSLDYAVCDTEGVPAETRDQFPPVYEYLAKSGMDRPVLELPVGPVGGSWYPYKYLHYQTGHWRPLLSGMSGWFPPSRCDLSGRTEDCPAVECLNFIRYTPAATLVVHLDKYPDAQRLAWETTDLSRFGFNFAGKFGSALVWEREHESEAFSTRLAVNKAAITVGDVPRKLKISLRPSDEGKAWRYFARAWTEIEVTVRTRQGEWVSFRKFVRIPSYLLPGESTNASISIKKFPSGEIAGIDLRGPLLDDYSVDFKMDTVAAKNRKG